MKKIVLFLFSLITLFCLSGCNSTSKEEQKEFFNELNIKMDEFSEKMLSTNQYVFDMDIRINYRSIGQTIKIQNDPFYLESKIDDKTLIYTTEENKNFEYIIDGNNVERKFVGFVSKEESSEIELPSEELINNDFNLEDFKLSKFGNIYQIEGLYKDYLGESNIEMLNSIYSQYDAQLNNILNEKLMVRFFFTRNSLKMTMKFSFLGLDVNKCECTYNAFISFRIQMREFKTINIFNGRYDVSAPQRAEEVLEITPLNEINESSTNKGFYKVELKKGILLHNLNDLNIDFRLIDSEGNEVKNPYNFPSASDNFLKPYKLLNIPYDGVYYLNMYNRSQYDVVSLYNLNYEDIYDERIEIYDGLELDLKIEGRYDFHAFKTNESDTFQSIEVTNQSDTAIIIYGGYGIGGNHNGIKIEPNGTEFISKSNSYTIFSCTQNGEFYKESNHKIKFEFKEFDTKSLDEMINIGKHEDVYFDGNHIMIYSYYEKGNYLYDFNKNYRIYFYDDNGHQLHLNINPDTYGEYKINNYFYIPKDGYYYIELINLSGSNKISLIKFEYDTVADLLHPIEPNIDGTNNIGVIEGYLDIQNYKLMNDSSETKLYELKNTGSDTLYLYSRNYTDDIYKQIILEPEETMFLTALGNTERQFYITGKIDKDYPQTEYSFSMKEVNPNNNPINDINIMPELTNEYSEVTYFIGYQLNYHYMKVTIPEKGKLHIDGDYWNIPTWYIYSLDGELLETNGSGNRIYEPGTYIVLFYTNDHNYYYLKLKYVLTTVEN